MTTENTHRTVVCIQDGFVTVRHTEYAGSVFDFLSVRTAQASALGLLMTLAPDAIGSMDDESRSHLMWLLYALNQEIQAAAQSDHLYSPNTQPRNRK